MERGRALWWWLGGWLPPGTAQGYQGMRRGWAPGWTVAAYRAWPSAAASGGDPAWHGREVWGETGPGAGLDGGRQLLLLRPVW